MRYAFSASEISAKELLMSRNWNGYLVKALNELASVYRAAKPADQIPASAMSSRKHRRRRHKQQTDRNSKNGLYLPNLSARADGIIAQTGDEDQVNKT
jgi:hypothetical protein